MPIEIISILLLFIVFFGLLAYGLPVAYSIGISTTITILLNIAAMPGLTTVSQRMTTGIDSFALLAIPFFVLAGELMNRGGIANRIINFAKSLIGGLIVDQMLNNYLSTAVLDAGDNRTNNDNDVADKEGVSYTTMEHKWDEAYGYLYGAEDNAAVPVLGADNFLNKYLSRVEGDSDFAGIADEIFQAFKLGRAAIVAKDYAVRDEQINIIKENISKVIAVRASHYLQSGKSVLGVDNAAGFHDLSEGYGFVYSLQFTRKPNSSEAYFSKAQVDAFAAQLMAGNGFWEVSSETLDSISDEIATAFGFTSAQAAN